MASLLVSVRCNFIVGQLYRKEVKFAILSLRGKVLMLAVVLAQGFAVPDNLSGMSIEYVRATLDSNATDNAHGELWLLDDEWILYWGQEYAAEYFVGGWEVAESEKSWSLQTVAVKEQSQLTKMAGRKVALLLFSQTDGGGATEAEKEWVLFDDVNLYACAEESTVSNKLYMPTLMRNFGIPTGPTCRPPTENPLDQYHSNRGLVQTGATCNSTLSNVDKADYYTFKPDKGGDHILHLSNLPEKTEWSAMIFTDAPDPQYAPGEGNGRCHIVQPGAGNKQVKCNLNKGGEYSVKVSAGSTLVAGSYTMRITAP